MVNIDIGTPTDAIISSEGRGILKMSRTNDTDINICIIIIHHLLVLYRSTIGLQSGFNVHGR